MGGATTHPDPDVLGIQKFELERPSKCEFPTPKEEGSSHPKISISKMAAPCVKNAEAVIFL